MKQTIASALVLSGFSLTIPAPFVIEPKYVVELPAKRKALIYETKVTRNNYSKGEREVIEVDGWRVIVVNKYGVADTSFIPGHSRHTFRKDDYGTEFYDPLSLSYYLKDLAVALAPKKRTVVQETEPDEDD